MPDASLCAILHFEVDADDVSGQVTTSDGFSYFDGVVLGTNNTGFVSIVEDSSCFAFYNAQLQVRKVFVGSS